MGMKYNANLIYLLKQTTLVNKSLTYYIMTLEYENIYKIDQHHIKGLKQYQVDSKEMLIWYQDYKIRKENWALQT